MLKSRKGDVWERATAFEEEQTHREQIREIGRKAPYHFTMEPYHEPVARVESGETVATYTEDAFGGSITSEEDRPSNALGPYLNPQTGPIYVEAPSRVTLNRPHRGDRVHPRLGHELPRTLLRGLTSTPLTATLQDLLPERVWNYQIEGEVARRGDWEIPVWPFVGTIGTSPPIEAISSHSPGDRGSNMGVPDTRIGNTVCLPVRPEGGLVRMSERASS